MKTPRLLLSLLLLALCLSACSKPSVNLSIASQPNVNPDHSGRPSPIIVKMYELRSDLAFKQLDFQTLFEKPVQALGADLIAADEIVLVPGEARKVAYMPSPDTRYVGLIGGFRQMERSHWREVRPVDSESGNLICVELNDASILLIPDDRKKSWDPEEAVRRFQQQLPRQNSPAAAQPGQYPAQYEQYPQAIQYSELPPAQAPAQYPGQTPQAYGQAYTPHPDANASAVYGVPGQIPAGSGGAPGIPGTPGTPGTVGTPASGGYSPSLEQAGNEAVRQAVGRAAGNIPGAGGGTTASPAASSANTGQGYILPAAKRIGF